MAFNNSAILSNTDQYPYMASPYIRMVVWEKKPGDRKCMPQPSLYPVGTSQATLSSHRDNSEVFTLNFSHPLPPLLFIEFLFYKKVWLFILSSYLISSQELVPKTDNGREKE